MMASPPLGLACRMRAAVVFPLSFGAKLHHYPGVKWCHFASKVYRDSAWEMVATLLVPLLQNSGNCRVGLLHVDGSYDREGLSKSLSGILQLNNFPKDGGTELKGVVNLRGRGTGQGSRPEGRGRSG